MTLNYELWNVWKENVLFCIKAGWKQFLEGPGESLKPSVRMHGLRMLIQSRYLPRTKQDW